MASAKSFFTEEQVKQIETAIHEAEKNTSGEIRVHIENRCKDDALVCATKIFHKIEMHKTDLRNAILFYLAIKDKKFAVVGDEGIHKHVPENFWHSVRDKVLEKFKQEKFTEGLCEGIAISGTVLKKYFPYSDADKNELSDEITFGKK
jgi:uncharacterized membrane protein